MAKIDNKLRLETGLKDAQLPGTWRTCGNMEQFKWDGGAVMNWFPTTGTLQFQGKRKEELLNRVAAVLPEILDTGMKNKLF